MNLISIIISICITQVVLCSELGVPVLLWQSKPSLSTGDQQFNGNEGLFESKSTVNQLNGNVLTDDYLSSGQTVVAFVQNRLSLEQFTAEDERRLSTIRQIFTDGSVEPTLLTDVINPTKALSEDRLFRRENWDQLSVKTGDKVWIELPKENLAENDLILGQLLDQIRQNVTKNTIYLITGRQNQYISQDLDDADYPSHRVRRAAPTEPPKVDKRLINIKDCLYFYTTYITVTQYIVEGKDIKQTSAQFDPNDIEPKLGNSSCWSGNEDGLLELTYGNPNGSQIYFTLDLKENNSTTRFWTVGNITIAKFTPKSGEPESTFKLNAKSIGSETKFSYSCSHLTLYGTDETNKTKRIGINFRNFQLQPFANPRNQKEGQRKYIFTDSFDCEVWFTLPLWMGLLTLLILLAILSFGVYFISIINTPDRFENPKGKPLLITNVDE